MNIIHQLYDNIAKNLGKTVSVTELTEQACVIRDSDMPEEWGIRLWHDERTGKIYIRGDFPKSERGTTFPTSVPLETITVSSTRSPASIVTTLKNRFITAYNKALIQGRQEYIADIEYHNRQKQLAEKFAKLVGGKVTQSGDRIDGKMGPKGYIQDMYVNATDNTISFDLRSVPINIAEKMLEIWIHG